MLILITVLIKRVNFANIGNTNKGKKKEAKRQKTIRKLLGNCLSAQQNMLVGENITNVKCFKVPKGTAKESVVYILGGQGCGYKVDH